MDMQQFKEEVRNMSYASMHEAYKDLSKLRYIVYLSQVNDRFIVELKNGEIFTITETGAGKTKELHEIFKMDPRIRISADWKKVEDYSSLSEIEKFNFIRHEINLNTSLGKLKDITIKTKGKYTTQRELINDLACTYGYLKRTGKTFEVYLGTNHDTCTVVELSLQKARTYYKLYHHKHQRDNFKTADNVYENLSPIGIKTFKDLQENKIKEQQERLNNTIKNLQNENKELRKVAEKLQQDIKEYQKTISKLLKEKKYKESRGIFSRIFNL